MNWKPPCTVPIQSRSLLASCLPVVVGLCSRSVGCWLACSRAATACAVDPPFCLRPIPVNFKIDVCGFFSRTASRIRHDSRLCLSACPQSSVVPQHLRRSPSTSGRPAGLQSSVMALLVKSYSATSSCLDTADAGKTVDDLTFDDWSTWAKGLSGGQVTPKRLASFSLLTRSCRASFHPAEEAFAQAAGAKVCVAAGKPCERQRARYRYVPRRAFASSKSTTKSTTKV